MKIIEAYELVLQKIEELKTEGIEVKIKPFNYFHFALFIISLKCFPVFFGTPFGL